MYFPSIQKCICLLRVSFCVCKIAPPGAHSQPTPHIDISFCSTYLYSQAASLLCVWDICIAFFEFADKRSYRTMNHTRKGLPVRGIYSRPSFRNESKRNDRHIPLTGRLNVLNYVRSTTKCRKQPRRQRGRGVNCKEATLQT
jgi:hypothetical protein